jgi:Tol biopolymer transport system component
MKIMHAMRVASALSMTTMAAVGQTNIDKLKLAVREISLGKLLATATGGKSLVSPDNRRVAYAVLRGGKCCVSLNGVEGKSYAKIEGITFSPDSQRLAYVARKGNASKVVVVNGEESREYDTVDPNSLTFSPNSERLAYIASNPGSSNLLIVRGDEKDGVEYDAVLGGGPGSPQLFFSPDSRKLAYGAARKTGKDSLSYEVVEAGAQRAVFPAPGAVGVDGYSPDSQHLAWVVEHSGKWRQFVDGQGGKEYDEVGHDRFRFSPDGNRWAYVARRGSQWLVVDKGQEGRGYDGIGYPSLTFSADSRQLAYVACRGEKYFVVTNGQEGLEYDGVASLQFSPDGQHVAFITLQGTRRLVLRDGKKSEAYDDVAEMFFSPDSQHLAYFAETGGRWRFVLNGKAGMEYEHLADKWACFSPDSKHVAYGAERERKLLVVVDDQEIGSYWGNLGTLAFERTNRLCGVASRMNERFDLEVVRLEIEITPR